VSDDIGPGFHWYDFQVLVRDLDPQAHVANHVYVAYLAEARSRLLARFEGDEETLRPSVVAEVRCRYLSPLGPREGFRVGVRVASVGRTSIGFEYEINAADRPVARGDSVEVLVDATSRRPRAIPRGLRGRLAAAAGA
jgi:acyl-CoA thioester hydrolase